MLNSQINVMKFQIYLREDQRVVLPTNPKKMATYKFGVYLWLLVKAHELTLLKEKIKFRVDQVNDLPPNFKWPIILQENNQMVKFRVNYPNSLKLCVTTENSLMFG